MFPVLLVTLIVAASGCTTSGNIPGDAGTLAQDSADFIYNLFFSDAPMPPSETIRIATWNIENFGAKKAGDQEVMNRIADMISSFDIVAIQEVSNIREASDPDCSRNQDSCPGNSRCDMIRNAFEESLNDRLDLNYSMVFSPQVRDERYLFIWDPEKATLLDSGLIADPTEVGEVCATTQAEPGLMTRQPFWAIFRADDFDFMLLTAHSSPGINVQELEGLEYFYRESKEKGEPDVILLGDLNADCNYLSESRNIRFRSLEYRWIVPGSADTTVSENTDCAYDRFIITQPTIEDYSGSWGIEKNITDGISDHFPVWAEFYIERDSD